MPAISVLVDGKTIATVNADEFDVVLVNVDGSRVADEFATLDMSGGCYPANGESTHLAWIDCIELQAGQRVEVRVLESGRTDPPGRKLEALRSEALAHDTPRADKSNAEAYDELRAMPARREGFQLDLHGTPGLSFSGRTNASDHAFSFRAAWSAHRPDRVVTSLLAYALDELLQQQPLRDLARGHLRASESVELRIDGLSH